MKLKIKDLAAAVFRLRKKGMQTHEKKVFFCMATPAAHPYLLTAWSAFLFAVPPIGSHGPLP